jgi:hypothetical protein
MGRPLASLISYVDVAARAAGCGRQTPFRSVAKATCCPETDCHGGGAGR